jgi:hypothetical protein
MDSFTIANQEHRAAPMLGVVWVQLEHPLLDGSEPPRLPLRAIQGATPEVTEALARARPTGYHRQAARVT